MGLVRATITSPVPGVDGRRGKPTEPRGSAELNALRERQFGRIVDCVRRSPHIRLPRVGAGFPAATGLFLPAKGATDLRTRRADVHIRDAAIGAAGGHEPCRLEYVPGEDR